MDVRNKRVAALGFCLVLVVLASMAAEASAAQCNLNSLWPCYGAVRGARVGVPTPSCCNAVRTVDPNCLCRQLLSGSYPSQMINNALQLPKKCNRYNLAGFRCGRYTVPH